MEKFKKGLFVLSLVCLTFGVISCSKNQDEDKEIGLDGYWKLGRSWCVKINSNQAILVLFNDTIPQFEGYSKFVKIGDVVIKNINKVDNNLWTAEEMGFWRTTEGKVTKIVWFNATYKLDDTGKILTRHVADKKDEDYHRVHKPTDDY